MRVGKNVVKMLMEKFLCDNPCTFTCNRFRPHFSYIIIFIYSFDIGKHDVL